SRHARCRQRPCTTLFPYTTLFRSKAVTLDGTVIELLANIEVPDDVIKAKAAGATGVGLYRTEFLFMNRREMPDEEEQYEAYRKRSEDHTSELQSREKLVCRLLLEK